MQKKTLLVNESDKIPAIILEKSIPKKTRCNVSIYNSTKFQTL